MKVYCKNCDWLSMTYIYGRIGESVCTNPRFSKDVDTPLQINKIYGDYKELNHDNSCSGYKEKSKTFMEKLRDE